MTDQSIFDEDRGDVSFTDDGICDENAYDERPEPLGRTELEASMLMRDVLHDIVDVQGRARHTFGKSSWCGNQNSSGTH